MLKYSINLTLMLFLFVCCTKNKADNIKKSTPDKAIYIDDNMAVINDTISISDIANDLLYIPLEKTKEKITIGRVMIDEQLVFILDYYTNSLYLFNFDGNFIRKISNERTEIQGFDLIREKKLILSSHNKGFSIYDYEGNLIKNTILDKAIMSDFNPTGNSIAAMDTSHILLSIWNMGYNEHQLIVTNSDGDILKAFPNTDKFTSEKIGRFEAMRFQRCLFKYYNSVMYHPYYSDTLYQWSDNLIEPVVIETKIDKVPVEQRLEYTGDLHSLIKYCLENKVHTTRFFVNSRYILAVYNLSVHQSVDSYLLFDKQEEKVYQYEQELHFNGKMLHYGIYNDFDGGMPFIPSDISGDYLIGHYDAFLFKERYLNGHTSKCVGENCPPNAHFDFRTDKFMNIKHKEAVDKLVNKIYRDDNPILMILILKK